MTGKMRGNGNTGCASSIASFGICAALLFSTLWHSDANANAVKYKVIWSASPDCVDIVKALNRTPGVRLHLARWTGEQAALGVPEGTVSQFTHIGAENSDDSEFFQFDIGGKRVQLVRLRPLPTSADFQIYENDIAYVNADRRELNNIYSGIVDYTSNNIFNSGAGYYERCTKCAGGFKLSGFDLNRIGKISADIVLDDRRAYEVIFYSKIGYISVWSLAFSEIPTSELKFHDDHANQVCLLGKK
jgi:hypothetical protein